MLLLTIQADGASLLPYMESSLTHRVEISLQTLTSSISSKRYMGVSRLGLMLLACEISLLFL